MASSDDTRLRLRITTCGFELRFVSETISSSQELGTSGEGLRRALVSLGLLRRGGESTSGVAYRSGEGSLRDNGLPSPFFLLTRVRYGFELTCSSPAKSDAEEGGLRSIALPLPLVLIDEGVPLRVGDGRLLALLGLLVFF
jgi:hypothetical protein